MKSRNPIQRQKLQTQLLSTQKEKEFRIERSVVQNIEVTSINKKRIIGKPIIHVSISCDKIVGTTHSFYDTLPNAGLQGYEFFLSNQTEGIKFIQPTDQPKDELDFDLIYEDEDGSNFFNGLPYDLHHNTFGSVAEQLAKRVEDRIQNDFDRNTRPDCPIQVTFLELFQATVVECEIFNKERSLLLLSETILLENGIISNRVRDLISSMFLCSLIYRKWLWWINLFSKEVIVNKNGICYLGQHYIPIDDRDLFLLQKLIAKKIHTTITVYPHPENPKKLFWVHNKRLIQIRPQVRNDFKVCKVKSETTN